MTAIVADGAALHGAANARLVARLERLPVTPRLMLIRVIVGIATFFDGFTVLAIAFAMPSLVSEWKLTPTEVGLILSAGYVGQLFGAVIFGSLAEKYRPPEDPLHYHRVVRVDGYLLPVRLERRVDDDVPLHPGHRYRR